MAQQISTTGWNLDESSNRYWRYGRDAQNNYLLDVNGTEVIGRIQVVMFGYADWRKATMSVSGTLKSRNLKNQITKQTETSQLPIVSPTKQQVSKNGRPSSR